MRKCALVKIVPMTKSRNITKTLMVCSCIPLRRAYTCLSFNILTYPAQGYTIYLAHSKSFNRK